MSNNHSGTRPWIVLALSWAALLAVGARAEMVVISEIMYHPKGGKPEYIEVSNNTATPFDIAQWQVTGGVQYSFPPHSDAVPGASFLNAFERVVLSSADEAATRAAYTVPPGVRVFGPWSGRLNDRTDRITLQDKNGVTVCTVTYSDRGRWPAAADGAGHSLVLKNPNRAVDDWRNWRASQSPDGTPGSEPVVRAETPVASPEINLAAGMILIDYGDTWRYHDGAQDLGTGWRTPGYNDQSWLQGPGLFGFENASLPAPGLRTPFNNSRQLTFYLRKTFIYSGDPQEAMLSLDQILDDGAVYYLNGQEIGRSRMPPGSIGFNTTSSDTVTDAVEELGVISTDGAALIQGANLLAVEVHQTSTSSSDVVFGARLRVAVAARPGVVINEVLPGVAGVGFIEFYNPTATEVNLRNHYLSDGPVNLQKFRIATDLVIPARGLGSVGFAEAGFAPASPLTIYLTAPDGTSPISALSGPIPLDGRSLGQKPSGSGQWHLFADPSRNQPNLSQETLAGALRLNEIHCPAPGQVDWIELHNTGAAAMPAGGLYVSAQRDFSDKVALTGQIEGRGFATFTVAFSYNDDLALYLIDGGGKVLDAVTLSAPSRGDTWQAFPDGSNEWFSALTSTPAAPNNPERTTDIVINEIMYDPPSNQVDAEYIELFNRGAMPVDLSGWAFEEGITFRFPPGTVLASGEYLVVAANSDRFRAAYGDLRMVGDYQGRLSNNGELLRLVDAWGNKAGEVDYKVGGDWPDLANGGGSSMELIHPWMDHSLPSAWKDSDESNKGPRRSYAYRDTYRQLRTFGAPSDYKEIYFHLASEGHVVLENVRLIRVSTGEDLLVNADRLSPNGVSAGGWLCQGTHASSFMTNGQLHIVSDGRGDNRANRVELDATAMVSGDLCEIRFDARWISGSPRLIFSTWDHSIASSFLLEIPQNLGTPGQPNSRGLAQAPPQVDRVEHAPAVPRSGENVRVTARVVAAGVLAAVELYHRADQSSGGGVWAVKAMFDDGVNGGDEIAGDGIFTAELTEHKVNNRVVQFYVQARTGQGETAVLPKWGAAKPALYVVDNRTPARDLRLARFVVSAYDLGAIASGNTAAYQFKFPRLSNHYKNATFISNEEEIFYNAEIRHSGSPWTRGGGLERGKFKLPKDRAFRSHVKFYYDNDPDAGRMYHNRITRYWLYLLGHPASENEFIRVIINSGTPALREDTEFVGNDFLDRILPGGSNGELYRIDDEWWFTDNWDRQNRDADWSYKNTDNPGRYRTEWMKRTRETEDDFTALITFFKTVSGTYSQAEIERLIDPEATLLMFAVRGYINDWDSISLNRGKNGFFYRRPTDGRFQFLQWDSDLTFSDPNASFYSGLPRVGPYIAAPYNLRRFYYYLAELVEKYTQNSARLDAWFEAEERSSPSFSVNTGLYRNWFNARNNQARQRMGANYTLALAVTTNGGQPITTSDDQIALSGTAPYGTFRLVVEGHPEATLTWNTATAWTLAGIQLNAVENQLRINALDQSGQLRRQVSLAVTKTGNAAPVLRLSANPASWTVGVQETLRLDARNSYDPEGTALNLAWQASPAPVSLDTSQPAQAIARFPRPGWYTLILEGSDLAGQTAQLTREASVCGPAGFSSFGGLALEAFWQLENVGPRNNFPSQSWISLDEKPGELTVQLLGETAQPLSASGARHPMIWRALPAGNAWSFHARLRSDTRAFGSFQTGVLVETRENGARIYYALGMEGGRLITVRRAQGQSGSVNLASVNHASSQAILRIRRSVDQLFFEQLLEEVWQPVHALTLPQGTTASRAGLFVATTEVEAVRVDFAYAALVDPSAAASLQSDLRLTEIMYNPVGGENFEFLELANLGLETLDLTGARFTEGIAFTFESTQLAAGERLVVAKDLPSFSSRYGEGVRAVGDFAGRLDNAGETLTLADASGTVIFSVKYGSGGDWPSRPNGFGSSLEPIDPRGDLNAAGNWRPSAEYHGSPGRPDAGPLRTVVINEVLPHTDPPLEDAIELHNLTGSAIDISGWFLSDSRDNYKKFRMPPGTLLPPNGYHVIYEEQLRSESALAHFSLSSVRGDDVYLTAADAAGDLTFFVDNVSFGPSENGVSFGRFPNGTGPLVPMAALTLGSEVGPRDPPDWIDRFRQGQGASNSLPKVGPIVFSQIMYHPPDADGEFIELLNISTATVPLYDPENRTNTWQVRAGIDYVFPPDIELPPGASLRVAGLDPAVFRARYEIPAGARVYGPFTGRLDNAGESIELYKPDPPVASGPEAGRVPYILVEKVRYEPVAPWPALANGQGPALTRINPNTYANDPSNWRAGLLEPSSDSDLDGMPDWWEIAFGFDPHSPADAILDFDGDGLSNLDEYLTGTNPLDPTSRFTIEAVHLEGLTLSLQFIAAADRSYSVQFRNAFGQGAWTPLTEVPARPSAEPVEVRVDLAASPLAGFFRIIVLPPP